MKRLILSTAVLALLAASWSLNSQSAIAQVPPPTGSPDDDEAAGTAVLVCYNLDINDGGTDAGAEEEEDSNESNGARLRLLTATFGADVVELDGLELICVSSKVSGDGTNEPDAVGEPAGPTKTASVSGTAATRVFACYGVENGNDERDSFAFMTETSGVDGVIVRRSDLLCEEAALTAEDGKTAGEATGALWLCHSLRGGSDADIEVDIANLFGTDEVDVESVERLCEAATEFGDDEAPTVAATADSNQDEETDLDMFACFELDGGNGVEETVTIETASFGEVEVVIGDAVLLCDAASAASTDGLFDDDDDDRPSLNGALNDEDDRPRTVTGAEDESDGTELDDELEAEFGRLIQELRDEGSSDLADRVTSALQGGE